MLALAFGACKKTKDSFTSRTYHSMVSKYNPLFNGQQALLKGQQSLRILHEDNFNDILPVFKTGTKEQASNVKPDMDKAMEKASKVITEHSMNIKNKQRNNFVDDSYLLLGKARYYKAEYLEALETFNYIIQQYPKSELTEEARLWAAHTETALGNYLAAKEKFENIYRSEDLPKKLKPLAFAAYAQLEIDQKRYTPAYQLLSQAVKRSKVKADRMRWTFIMGQLQAKVGNDHEASELYRRVIKMGPPYAILFQAQLNRARHYDVDINDPEVVFEALRKMLKDDKNFDNKDQIYYVMAELSERMYEDAEMEDYLRLSIRSSTINQNQKALSYLKLGEVNFDNSLYPLAAAYYDSAFTNLNKTHPRYDEIAKKNASLSDLVKHLHIIAHEDSVQTLANMSEADRLQKIDNMILRKKADEEAARKAEEENPFNEFLEEGTSVAQSNQGAIQGGVWYFYNQRLRSGGITEFNMKFGNRRLEDNWRRENKEVIEAFEVDNDESQKEMDELTAADSVKTEDEVRQEYLDQIPLTEEAMATSHAKVIGAFLAVATIYKEDFSDLPASEAELRALLKRYPDMDEKAKVWYMLHRINLQAKDQADADKYKNLVLQNFPKSDYAALLRGEVPDSMKNTTKSGIYYKLTYIQYEKRNYRKAVSMADSALAVYSKTEEGPKYMMVKGFSEGKLRKKDAMLSSLRAVIKNYPGTEEAAQAQKILDQITGPKVTEADKAKGKAKEAESMPNVPVGKYKQKPNEQHKYILALPNIRGLVNNVTIELSDFNKKYFKNMQLNTKAVYVSAQQQMIMISGLANEKEALRYFEVLKEQKVLDQSLSGQTYQHFVISNSNFSKFYQDKNFTEYESYFKATYLKKK